MTQHSTTLKSLVVMFVDDEERILRAFSRTLSDEFKNLIVATDGAEAVKKFKKFKPDIIVADINMPIMDGLEMAKEIKAISKTTPIIALSAYSDKQKLLKAINIGIDKYVIKPVDIDKLLKVIEEVSIEFLEANDTLDIAAGYKFDRKNRVLIKNGTIIRLTKKELQFISLLAKQLGTLVLHENIKKVVWTDEKVTDAAIRTFIKRIRDKVGHELIENVPGLGYRINND